MGELGSYYANSGVPSVGRLCAVSKLSVVSTVEWLGGVRTSWRSPAWGHCGSGPECPAWGYRGGDALFLGDLVRGWLGNGEPRVPAGESLWVCGVPRELSGGHGAGTVRCGVAGAMGGGSGGAPLGAACPRTFRTFPGPPLSAPRPPHA